MAPTLAIAGLVGSLVLVTAGFLWSTRGRLTAETYDAGEIVVGDGPDPEVGTEFVAVTYNVGFASGLDNNTPRNPPASEYAANLSQMVSALATLSPDFIALQEVDYDSARSHGQDQMEVLAEGLGLRHCARSYSWDRRYLPFPYWPPRAHYGAVLAGQAILSRYRVAEQSKVTLPKPANNPFWYNAYYPDRLVQIAKVQIGSTTLTVANIHLEAYQQPAREVQAHVAAEVIRGYMDEPLLVIGDFNATPPWNTENIDEALDLEKGDRPLDTVVDTMQSIDGLRNAMPEEPADGERYYSFRSDDPRVAIDHIFYNRFIERVSVGVLAEAGTASDHLPVWMRFRMTGD